MKKRKSGKKNRQVRKSAVSRPTVRKKLFSKRRGGVLNASMILENRSLRGDHSESNKKDII